MNREVVVNFSGGVCSFLAACRAVERYDKHSVTLLFADTGEEHHDLYRFIDDAVAYLGCRFVKVCNPLGMDGLIDRHQMIPNTRVAFCTQELKREPAEKWIKENAPGCLQVFGIDWTETRDIGIKRRLGEENVWCPMQDKPYLSKSQMLQEVERRGLRPSESYAQGFIHDNCGGGCIKAGHASWAHLLKTRPEVYAKWVEREERVSAMRGSTCAILRDRRNGATAPLPLTKFAEQADTGQCDLLDFGGCGCFTDDIDVVVQ